MSILTKDIDSRPYTGKRNTEGVLTISNAEHLRKFFDGTENYEQVTGVKQGGTYKVVSVEGHGDCEDVTIIDDNGCELTLGDFFFEEENK